MFRKLEDAMANLLTLSAVIAGMTVCAQAQNPQEPSQGAVPAVQGPELAGQGYFWAALWPQFAAPKSRLLWRCWALFSPNVCY